MRSAVSSSGSTRVELGPTPAWGAIVVWDTVAASPHDGPLVGTVLRQVPSRPPGRKRGTRRPSPARAVLRIASLGVLLACLVTWFSYFRPQFLGGPVEFVGVNGISMSPTLHLGDLAVVEKRASYHLGEIIVYRIPKGDPGAGDLVIHRIVGGSGTAGFVTKGDHNHYTDHFWHPRTQDVIGAVWFHIPRGALVLSKLHDPIVLAVVVAVVTLAVLAWPLTRRRDPPGAPAGDAVVIQVPERHSEQAA